MEIQIKRVLTETKQILRRKIKCCDVCGSKRFRFEFSEHMESTILVTCRYCKNRLYIGGDDVNE